MRKTLLLLSAAAVVSAPAALSAQTAYRNLNSRYVQEAQQQHPAVIQEFGGRRPARAAPMSNRSGAELPPIPASIRMLIASLP
jgi:hypothetical protein